jgi:hypothetical protein
MSADSVPSSKTNIFQIKLIYCRHFRTYSRCAMFDWNDTVFRRRNVTRRRISNTVLQPRYWGREADSPEVCRLTRLDANHRSHDMTLINILQLFSCFEKLNARDARHWSMFDTWSIKAWSIFEYFTINIYNAGSSHELDVCLYNTELAQVCTWRGIEKDVKPLSGKIWECN